MQNTDRAPGFFSVASWPLCVSRDLERRPPAGGRAQGGVPVLAHQVAARGWSEQSCLPTRPPDCHRTLASTTDRPRLSPPPLPPAFRPQHQPLSGLRAAPARPPELADVIATQCTRHQAPRIRCMPVAVRRGTRGAPNGRAISITPRRPHSFLGLARNSLLNSRLPKRIPQSHEKRERVQSSSA